MDEENVAEEPLADMIDHSGTRAQVPLRVPSQLQDMSIQDHFTLPDQSSTVRHRSSVLKVFPNRNSQFILENRVEESGEETSTMKQTNDSSPGLYALRSLSTLIAVFFCGFLVIFCICTLLFLVVDIAIASGSTSSQSIEPAIAIGTFLGLPLFIYGLASLLVFAGNFVADTWRGSPLIKRYCFGTRTQVFLEWIIFVGFLLIPILTACISLLAQKDGWWTNTVLAWFSVILAFYLLFLITVSYFEVHASWNLLTTMAEDDGISNPTFWQICRRAILLRERASFSGYKTSYYSAIGDVVLKSTSHEFTYPYSRLTLWEPCAKSLKLFHVLEEPQRLVSVQETLGTSTYITAGTWSLEKVYCRPRRERLMVVIKGRDKLTQAQVRSTFACAVVGNLTVLLVFISALIYLHVGTGSILFLSALAILFWIIPHFRRLNILRISQRNITLGFGYNNFSGGEQVSDENGAVITETKAKADEQDTQSIPHDAEESGMNFVRDSYRLSEPNIWLLWVLFGLQFVCLFVWPLISLYLLDSTIIASQFVIVALFAGLRYYFNPVTALQEVGTLKHAARKDKASLSGWNVEARLCRILLDVSLSRSGVLWSAVLCFIVFILLTLCFMAVATGTADSDSAFSSMTYLNDFTYIAKETLPYPTCTIGKTFISGLQQETRLIDFAFLSLLAYKDETIAPNILQSWYVNSTSEAALRQDIVNEFRESTKSTELPVSYKLILDETTGVAVVMIEGTSNFFDLLADAQLWFPAFCFQILREVLPFGFIFTEAMDELLVLISGLQSSSSHRLSFYKETTDFVNYLTDSGIAKSVSLTGHSLGGGLAIISGAQTQQPAVAISGINAKLSRRTFLPKLTLGQLDTYTFNIVPERDPIAHIDDVAKLHQDIKCTADKADLFGCHSSDRSFCELLVSCGSNNRPAVCECATLFGYPQPTATGNRTFEEACAGL